MLLYIESPDSVIVSFLFESVYLLVFVVSANAMQQCSCSDLQYILLLLTALSITYQTALNETALLKTTCRLAFIFMWLTFWQDEADSTRSHIRKGCGSLACLKLYSYSMLQFNSILLCLQALFALDAASAQEAMLQFQSCVRTTLLLCDGYECQEKVQDFCRTQTTQKQHLAMLKLTHGLCSSPNRT